MGRCVCVCARARASVRVCVRVCASVYVRPCVRVCGGGHSLQTRPPVVQDRVLPAHARRGPGCEGDVHLAASLSSRTWPPPPRSSRPPALRTPCPTRVSCCAAGVCALCHEHGWVRVPSRSISPPWGVNSISSGSPRVRPMGRTCGEPDEIKKNTHPKYITALFRAGTPRS